MDGWEVVGVLSLRWVEFWFWFVEYGLGLGYGIEGLFYSR